MRSVAELGHLSINYRSIDKEGGKKRENGEGENF